MLGTAIFMMMTFGCILTLLNFVVHCVGRAVVPAMLWAVGFIVWFSALKQLLLLNGGQ
jgi:hypothetical protein